MKDNIKMIVATDECCGIGYDNDLAWHSREDLQRFKKLTSGKIIIMGRKCLESLPNGKPLPNRTNVVLTRKVPENPITGVIYMHCIEDVLEFVGNDKAWVIGGAEIYKLFLDIVSKIHETNIRGDYECDTFLSLENNGKWDTEEVFPFSSGDIAESVTIWSRK